MKFFIEVNNKFSRQYMSNNYFQVWKDQLLELGYKLK